MTTLSKTLAPIFILFFAFTFFDAGISVDYADAKSFKGGKMFKMSPKKAAPSKTKQAPNQSGGNFRRGLAGGLLGGALGGLLFGSMFGAGGSGMGILPILLLGGVAYFLFKKFSRQSQNNYQSHGQGTQRQGPIDLFGSKQAGSNVPPPQSPIIGGNLLEEGLDQIRETDRGFDPNYFIEVASDVFFQVQAGWMRRDLDSYRHLLGDQLAQEYAGHFADMTAKGHINKLESIAVRTIELVEAGSDGNEDFVTVLFSASLLDYTVDDKTGDVVEGSDSTPVKFEEKWTWARPTGTQDWKLEGIHDS